MQAGSFQAPGEYPHEGENEGEGQRLGHDQVDEFRRAAEIENQGHAEKRHDFRFQQGQKRPSGADAAQRKQESLQPDQGAQPASGTVAPTPEKAK